MKPSLIVLFTWVVSGLCSCVSQKYQNLCPGFILEDSPQLKLSDTEKQFVCGDPNNPAWKTIPDSQAKFHFRTFLQQRGYYSPTFEEQDNQVIVKIGERTKVRKFTVVGSPVEVKFRNIEGEILTPSLLDSAKKRLGYLLEQSGYPCYKIEVEAVASTGELTARIDPGNPQNLVSIEKEPIEGVNVENLSRYNAFELGKPYDIDSLTVTMNRILSEGIVQGTHFIPRCTEKGALAKQKFVAGPPRLVTLGIGADTEQIIVGRASWKHVRLGENASPIDLVAMASFKVQELLAWFKWYPLKVPSRFHLRPSLILRHSNDQHLENLTLKTQLAPASTWDTEHWGLQGMFGPTFNYTRTFRGSGPPESIFLSWNGEIEFQSHDFELYRTDPRTGTQAKLQVSITEKSALSPVSARLIRLSFEQNWNLMNWEPPALVFSIRAGLGTTWTGEDVTNPSSTLPSDLRHYLGGSADLRGFGRRELGGHTGALTAVFLGLEARVPDIFPWGLQPFLFTDLGGLGKKSFQLDSPLFASPGVGIRWDTQIGVIRSTLAHGMHIGNRREFGAAPPHWQFYFSYGEEF